MKFAHAFAVLTCLCLVLTLTGCAIRSDVSAPTESNGASAVTERMVEGVIQRQSLCPYTYHATTVWRQCVTIGDQSLAFITPDEPEPQFALVRPGDYVRVKADGKMIVEVLEVRFQSR